MVVAAQIAVAGVLLTFGAFALAQRVTRRRSPSSRSIDESIAVKTEK